MGCLRVEARTTLRNKELARFERQDHHKMRGDAEVPFLTLQLSWQILTVVHARNVSRLRLT